MALTLNREIFSNTEWVEIAEKLSLSTRQGEISRYLLHGLSDKQIALQLKIAVPTVRTHLSRLFSKMKVQDRIELILYIFYCFRNGGKAN